MTKIPYIPGFNAYLKTRAISSRAHTEYLNSLHDFFDYLVVKHPSYKATEDLTTIHEQDLRIYKDYLMTTLKLSPSTINKILSNLNIYFKYLFANKKIKEIPTLNITSLKVPTQEDFPVDVFLDLPRYLNDISLHVYPRLLILAISKGFTYQRALAEGFYQIFQKLAFLDPETSFLSEYDDFIEPYRNYWHNQNLFLSRNKGAKSPLLSTSALHRDIKKDSDKTNLDLTPKKLYTTFILLLLSEKEPNDEQLKIIEHLDTSSLLYYRRLLRESDFENI